MIEIKIQTDEDLYKAIVDEAKNRGITIDNFITEAIIWTLNSKRESNKSIDFDKKLEDSLERNKEIYKKLADR